MTAPMMPRIKTATIRRRTRVRLYRDTRLEIWRTPKVSASLSITRAAAIRKSASGTRGRMPKGEPGSSTRSVSTSHSKAPRSAARMVVAMSQTFGRRESGRRSSSPGALCSSAFSTSSRSRNRRTAAFSGFSPGSAFSAVSVFSAFSSFSAFSAFSAFSLVAILSPFLQGPCAVLPARPLFVRKRIGGWGPP